METATVDSGLQGFITDRHLDEANEAFPGIKRFYIEMPVRARTFLDLVRLFEAHHTH